MNRRGIFVAVALVVGLVALGLLLRACVRRFGDGEASAASSAGTSGGAALGDASGPRCVRAPGAATLGDGLSRGDLLIGEAAAVPEGYAIGLIRFVGKERRASVATVSSDGQRATFVDIGPALGEIPPPLPFLHRGRLFAASYGRSGSHAAADASRPTLDAPRTLSIVRIDGAHPGKADPPVEIAQQSDESMAVDVATSPEGRGIVVWDDDAAASGDAGASPLAALGAPRGPARGVIKALPVPGDGEKPAAAVVVSSSGADVERPRAIARAGGYWVAWIARRLDPRGESDPKATEGPGEDRSYAWIEMAKVDDAGKRLGDVRRVTSDAGHVTAFEWLAGEGGKLDLFVRDDAEMSQEGEGGRILRVAVRDDGPQSPEAIVGAGVGQGDPAAVGGPGGRWLFYADVAEHTHGIFLDSTAVAAAVPAVDPSMGLEPALDGKSPLFARLEHSAALVLAVGPSGEGKDQAEAHIIRCEALNR